MHLELQVLEERREHRFNKAPLYSPDGAVVSPAALITKEHPPVYGLISRNPSINMVQIWTANYSHWLFDAFSDWFWLRRFFGEPLLDWTVFINKGQPEILKSTLSYAGFSKIEEYHYNTPAADQFLFSTNTVLNYQRRSNFIHPTISESLRSLRNRDAKPTRRILIQRSKLGDKPEETRNIINRDDLLSCFESKGLPLEMVYLEGMTFEQQIDLFSSASLIIAVHGAALTNMVFCSSSARLVEIRSRKFFQDTYESVTGFLDLDHRVILGMDAETNAPNIAQHPVKVMPEVVFRIATET